METLDIVRFQEIIKFPVCTLVIDGTYQSIQFDVELVLEQFGYSDPQRTQDFFA